MGGGVDMCEAEGVGVRVLLRCDEESCDDCVAGTTRSGGGMSSPTKLSCDMAGEREVDVAGRGGQQWPSSCIHLADSGSSVARVYGGNKQGALGENDVVSWMRWTMEAAGDFATTVSVWLHRAGLDGLSSYVP